MRLRIFYFNDIRIIAPLKCGTRWLYDKAKKSAFIHIDDLREQTNESDYFLYREGRDHLISALHTDYIRLECNLEKTIKELINNESPHWRGDLFENVHRAWCYKKFKMVEYTNICELIGNYELNKDLYDFSKQSPYVTKQMVLDMLDTDTKNLLFEMADNNNYWLNQINEGNDKFLSKNTMDRLEKEFISKEQHYKLINDKQAIINVFLKKGGKRTII